MTDDKPHNVVRKLRAVGTAAVTVLGLAVTAAPRAQALPDGLALTPPMGFNNWNTTGCKVDEKIIRDTADIFVTQGLKAAGYQYVNVDDCWAEPKRDAAGKLQANHARFPSGIKALSEIRQLQQPGPPRAGALPEDAGRVEEDRPPDRVLALRMGREQAMAVGRRRRPSLADHRGYQGQLGQDGRDPEEKCAARPLCRAGPLERSRYARGRQRGTTGAEYRSHFGCGR